MDSNYPNIFALIEECLWLKRSPTYPQLSAKAKKTNTGRREELGRATFEKTVLQELKVLIKSLAGLHQCLPFNTLHLLNIIVDRAYRTSLDDEVKEVYNNGSELKGSLPAKDT